MTTEEILQECKVIGNNIKLLDALLDYKTEYLPLKKKLEGIGGKWHGGKTEAFVFDSDPSELLEQLQDGKQINLKKDFQYFSTPMDLGMHLIGLSPISLTTPNIKFLEPSAGDGALIKCIHEINPDIVIDCFELMPQNIKKLEKIEKINIVGKDFLNDTIAADGFAQFDNYDLIIANPPFTKNQDIDHIYQMYRCLKDGGALVTIASKSWTFGEQKKQVEFKTWLSAIGAYTEEIDAGKFKESGTLVGAMIISLRKNIKDQYFFPVLEEPIKESKEPIWSEAQLKEMNVSLRKPPVFGLQEDDGDPVLGILTGYKELVVEEHQSPEEIGKEIESSLTQALESIKSVNNSLKTETDMDFFKQISDILGNGEMSITLKAKDDKLTVMVMPKSNTVVKPLIVTGTGEELDEGFFNLIAKPVTKVIGLASNISGFEDQTGTTEEKKTATASKAKAKAKTAETPKAEEKEEVVPTVDPEKEARKKKEEDEAAALALEEENRIKAEQERIAKHDEIIASAKKLEEEKEFKAAAIATKSAKEFSLNPEELDAKVKELMQKHFDAEMAGL